MNVELFFRKIIDSLTQLFSLDPQVSKISPYTDEMVSTLISNLSEIYKSYNPIATMIEARPAKILDLGCGCGALLKYLINKSISEKLIPYGIDYDKQAIKQAINKMLPEYKENFLVEDIAFYKTKEKFDYVITNPIHNGPNYFILDYSYLLSLLNDMGVLFIVITRDTSHVIKQCKRLIKFLNASGVKWIGKDESVLIGYVKKDNLEKYLWRNGK